ncbi:hypothetical protein M2651_12765 [Clostridium sp. SYSU_GA19001]|uniref:hypothetical protein n=1 Tax=Clostridium caldaquaticum TaxID=2940653 RepID=UPI0020772137|nr:hypothetical protein [Clostridium caldaquaticum]MCM8711869.1 hypothetical protein [Clostridium caldaquaticum]
MKKIINILGWVGVSLTIISLILTMLSTYHFVYIKYFYDYYTLQWCLFFTMIVWGIRIFYLKSSFRDLIYTAICFIMAFGSMFFRLMRVQ